VSRVAFIPRHAPNPEAARAFLCYVLSPQGQASMVEGGLIALNTSQVHTVASIPLDENFTHFIDTTLRASPLARWRAVVGGPAVSTRGTRS